MIYGNERLWLFKEHPVCSFEEGTFQSVWLHFLGGCGKVKA
jgi:hypothetical protein